jgi:GMP synthase-like glutamine amidotransferase
VTAKRGLIIEHGDDAPPARLAEWCDERGLTFDVVRAGERPLPDPAPFAFVVSLGSEESAGARSPAWIARELDVLRDAVAAEVPVLGLCFGGQALSVALGAQRPARLPAPEVGWLELDSFDQDIPRGPWLFYHNEQLRLAPGARELARGPAGPAAFSCGPHLGLQFHPEVDAALVASWARTDPYLPASGLTPEELAAQSARYAAGAREHAFALFDAWLAHALAAR